MQQIAGILFTKGRIGLMAQGFINTLIITFFAVLIGIVIGTILAIFKVLPQKKIISRVLSRIAGVYIGVIRGTPILVQLMIFYYIVFYGVRINSLFVAAIGFGINSGAYVAEIMRSGILAVDIGQTEAGRSLGLGYRDNMILIVLPQALKNILPALGNEAIMLVKETSVASVITVTEFFNAIKLIGKASYNVTVPYLFSALVYLVTVLLMTWGISRLEAYLRKGDMRQ
ncbi:MAG: amino acid ABC transporter permease [Treponema sp.]|jgi:His/Glu/Gln/Arg/opine family amino acid ABC transporter permease subunit|nr:amino acid ABC transporter permease [Treponema sp.]